VYRYWNGKDHFYTTDSNEIGVTVQGETGKHNYKCEGILGQVYNVEFPYTYPIYRYFNGTEHFYTADADEIGTTEKGQKGKANMTCEGVLGYVYN